MKILTTGINQSSEISPHRVSNLKKEKGILPFLCDDLLSALKPLSLNSCLQAASTKEIIGVHDRNN